jgi:hypothetical protein
MPTLTFLVADAPGVATFWGIFWLFIILFMYFLPAIAARKKQCLGSVFVLNFFLGWTLIGWVVALAWAVKDPEPPPKNVPLASPLLCSACGKYSTGDSRFCTACGNSFALASRAQ